MTSETVHGYVAENCQKVSNVLLLDKDEYIEQIQVPYTNFDQYILNELANGALLEPKMLAIMMLWRNMMKK